MKDYIPFKSLWQSKRAQIPILSDAVNIFLDIVPTPIKILLFILLLSLLANFIMPTILGTFGYSCVIDNGDLELYKVPFNNLFQKSFQDASFSLRGFLNLPDYELPEDAFPYGTKKYIKIPDGCFATAINDSKSLYGYSSSCVDCPQIGTFSFAGINITTSTNLPENSVCIGDGYYKKTIWNSIGSYEKNFCYRCAPPTGYYYNHSEVLEKGWVFTIEDESYLPSIDENYFYNVQLNRIKNLGGVKQTQDSSQFVNIQCEEYGKPQLYFFTIKVFDQMMWILIIIGSVVVGFAIKWYTLIL